jgi:hypothetical protein
MIVKDSLYQLLQSFLRRVANLEEIGLLQYRSW